MSSLVGYAKAFGIPTNNEMSHVELATLVANHFLVNTVDENKVIQGFATKTENLKRESRLHYKEPIIQLPTKRQPKKPKKFTQNDDGAYHYNTRSRHAIAEEKDAETTGTEDEGQKYCFCNGKEDGGMVQCENPDCERKWFHYRCVGITDPSSLPLKWYCPTCREFPQFQNL